MHFKEIEDALDCEDFQKAKEGTHRFRGIRDVNKDQKCDSVEL